MAYRDSTAKMESRHRSVIPWSPTGRSLAGMQEVDVQLAAGEVDSRCHLETPVELPVQFNVMSQDERSLRSYPGPSPLQFNVILSGRAAV